MHSLWLLLGPISGLITSRMIGQPLLRGMFLGAGGALIGAGIHRLLYMERRGVSLPASVLVAALIVTLLYSLASRRTIATYSHRILSRLASSQMKVG